MSKEIFKIAEQQNLVKGVNTVGTKVVVSKEYFLNLLETKIRAIKNSQGNISVIMESTMTIKKYLCLLKEHGCYLTKSQKT